jgi:hypothetical protein
LALIFMILAMGSLLDPDGNTQGCDMYFSAAQDCLMTPNFLRNNTVAAVQALVRAVIGRADGITLWLITTYTRIDSVEATARGLWEAWQCA